MILIRREGLKKILTVFTLLATISILITGAITFLDYIYNFQIDHSGILRVFLAVCIYASIILSVTDLIKIEKIK